MGKAAGRCAYAEARHVERRDEALAVRAGEVDEFAASAADGIGVRVRVGGAWGFAATRDVCAAVAEAQPTTPAAPLAPAPPARGHWSSPHEIDPFDVSLEDKLGVLFDAEAALRTDRDERVVRSVAALSAWREHKAFASTEGAACTQELVGIGAGLGAWATDGTELQVRSYPLSHGGLFAAAGWEHVLALDLAAHAPRVASEAVELLSAPPCPEGVTTIVLDGEQLALQVHESIGHALELDRMLLYEASYAGTSWVRPDDAGSLRYGSERLNVTADATLPGGLGSFGWDDEGVPAARYPLIEAGVLRATLSNRESAALAGLERSGGCARADGFARQPIVRMTNVSIEPGDAGALEDLIADTDDGLYLETNRSWSIDDRRLQFQFATEVAREVRGGRLGRLDRNPSYAGITPRLWGLTNCGKGEPGQIMAVSHGAAPGRFREVQVGVA